MKIHYHQDTDSLYVELSEKPSVGSKETCDGVVVDFDSEGAVVGIDIDHLKAVTTTLTEAQILSAMSECLDPERAKEVGCVINEITNRRFRPAV